MHISIKTVNTNSNNCVYSKHILQ